MGQCIVLRWQILARRTRIAERASYWMLKGFDALIGEAALGVVCLVLIDEAKRSMGLAVESGL